MWPSIGRTAGFALTFAVPGWIVIAGLLGIGLVSGGTALAAAIAVLVLTFLAALPLALALGAMVRAIETLGPDAASPVESRWGRALRRLSPAARTLWPALLRLRRAWREHAAGGEARVAAAEAIIAAMPDPLILIDSERRIVRANPASVAFVGALGQPRDLAAALRKLGQYGSAPPSAGGRQLEAECATIRRKKNSRSPQAPFPRS